MNICNFRTSSCSDSQYYVTCNDVHCLDVFSTSHVSMTILICHCFFNVPDDCKYFVSNKLLLVLSVSSLFPSRDRYDAVFEQISMLINVALWYSKHAAKLAGDEEYVVVC